MSNAAWETTARERVLDASPWLRVHRETVRLPDGRVVEGYYTTEAPAYALVVAVTPDDRVLLLRGYRHGPRRVTLSLPGGHVDDGETPEAAARRELLEETGHEAPEWRHLGTFATDGNRGGAAAHYYLARGARKVAEARSGDLEEHTLEAVPIAEARRALANGEVATLGSAAALAMGLSGLTT